MQSHHLNLLLVLLQCFRLYSKQYFQSSMPDVALPEIQRTSMAGAVLQIKALQLDLDVLNFDFLDRPDQVGREQRMVCLSS
jgi:HrpA-like RNA helicase